jgi:hypothetical protein
MGAVFMVALTYIGNAPNFMVYAIASERGVPMPSFFGFVGWSVAILMPVFAVLATFVSSEPYGRGSLTARLPSFARVFRRGARVARDV